MNDLKPGPIITLGGALVLLISVFLPWADFFGVTKNGTYSDLYGLIGIFVLIMAIAVGVLTGLDTFADGVNMPANILGYTPSQLSMVLGVASFLSTFGLQFAEFTGVGILIAWIGAAAIVAGSILQMREGATAAPSGPAPGSDGPSTF